MNERQTGAGIAPQFAIYLQNLRRGWNFLPIDSLFIPHCIRLLPGCQINTKLQPESVMHRYDKDYDYDSRLLIREISWTEDGWPEVKL